MAHLTIYKDNDADSTVVPNRFIDEYMKDANDAQLKVYFYLLRMFGANQSATSVSDIADKFNHTEKEVVRALHYWEQNKLIDLEYDENKNLVGIHLHEQIPTTKKSNPDPTTANNSINLTRSLPSQTTEKTSPFTKPIYSPDQLREFKNREETAQLLFIAESYIGRPLTPAEIKCILFFMDVLHFSDDLIDYLLQYCVDRGKKDFTYIEKVAINWADEGITTPKQAQNSASRYDKNVYTIMNGLGKHTTPTLTEMEYINRWTKDYGFSQEIIMEACERTVLATDRHRFEYAESILKNWKQENVCYKSDILRIDKMHQKKKSITKTPVSTNKFNQFTQNKYDFDALEKELLSN